MTKTKVTFKQFHGAYGKAYGAEIDRVAAERAWNGLNDHDRRAAIAGITGYRDYCRSRGIAMKYPSGYLSLHRWEIKVAEPQEVSGFKFQVSSKSGTEKEHPETCNLKPETNNALADMDEW